MRAHLELNCLNNTPLTLVDRFTIVCSAEQQAERTTG